MQCFLIQLKNSHFHFFMYKHGHLNTNQRMEKKSMKFYISATKSNIQMFLFLPFFFSCQISVPTYEKFQGWVGDFLARRRVENFEPPAPPGKSPPLDFELFQIQVIWVERKKIIDLKFFSKGDIPTDFQPVGGDVLHPPISRHWQILFYEYNLLF